MTGTVPEDFFPWHDAMLEIPGGPVKISTTALSHHVDMDADSWSLQLKPGGLTILRVQLNIILVYIYVWNCLVLVHQHLTGTGSLRQMTFPDLLAEIVLRDDAGFWIQNMCSPVSKSSVVEVKGFWINPQLILQS